ncbi:unnamed protein product, partial [Aureobasidium vineae]
NMPGNIIPEVLEVPSPSVARTRLSKPLEYSGLLDPYQNSDLTPVIGREYIGLQVADVLAAKDSDALIRDIAVTVSQRGVVFLRNQDVAPQQMQAFMERLTTLSGCLGDQISVISSEKQKKGGGLTHQLSDTTRFASAGWHSDITFEPVPSDYAMLKIHTLPQTGGDVSYEVYDRLSPALAQFLEGLTATHEAKFFHEEAARLGNPLRTTIRGSPLNQGPALEAVHPIIRTNPVTGWKSVYVNRGFTRRINGVTKDESDVLLQYLFNVRFKWNKNDLAIWDNRSTWHTATYDYEAARAGDRVCSLGEKPFLDPASSSRRDALRFS